MFSKECSTVIVHDNALFYSSENLLESLEEQGSGVTGFGSQLPEATKAD